MSEYDEEKSGLSFLSKALIVLVSVAAALALFYYFSARNAGRYKLILDGNKLVVEKGLFFPIGMGRYEPEDKRFLSAYEPIEVPAESSPPADRTFHELADIDVALLNYILDVSKDLVAKGKPENFDQALKLLKRVDELPALSNAQRQKIRDTKADVYYSQGKLILQKVADELRTVLEHFREAKNSGGSTGKYRDIDHWIALLESKIRYIESGESTLPPQTTQPRPMQHEQMEQMKQHVRPMQRYTPDESQEPVQKHIQTGPGMETRIQVPQLEPKQEDTAKSKESPNKGTKTKKPAIKGETL
ncbi:MAG: tetratricopeptide repeat protein [Deltaproteobacteria bacterium]|nr:tetratricopeptide repeat protein [Deltaproteobacteria bacterium]